MTATQGAWANIPPRGNRRQPICFGSHLYKARNLVEPLKSLSGEYRIKRPVEKQ
jgi:hypothetical protein